MIAEIIINSNARALNRIFDYIVPIEFENSIKIGSRVFVPFGNSKKLEDGFVIGLKDKSSFANKNIEKILEDKYLTEEKVTLAKLMSKKYFCNISDCIRLMLPPGTASNDVRKRISDKTGNFIYLNKSKEEIDFELQTGKIKSEKHIRTLNFLKNNDGIYITDLENFLDISKSVINTLEKKGYIQISKEKIERNPFKNKKINRDEKKVLNTEQKECFLNISKSIDEQKYSNNLIFGVTGSGKTEVYLQLIEKVINNGKSAIVLVPEISLTPQMVDRFRARFGDIVAVLHSKLSVGERYDEWNKIYNDEVKIVIGARSAIFAPVRNIGIIIIDEEHDISYKSDSTPRYNAKELAAYIAKNNNCPLVLGSATPDVCTYYKAEKNKINKYTLLKRANSASLPDVEIVDLREELANGNKSMISIKLENAIEENLKNNKQTILFLNRRGYSTFVMCRDCGYTAKCKHCNISLTYHKKENKLKCHYCGYEISTLKTCPECNSNRIKYFGTGTQKLEEEVNRIFPNVTTIRMDIDTVSKKNSHEEILDKFKNENINILIGTQMVVKGHHFPNVTLVGVIAADGLLNLEDYRAVEKTFQTLVQVSRKSRKRKRKGKSNNTNI